MEFNHSGEGDLYMELNNQTTESDSQNQATESDSQNQATIKSKPQIQEIVEFIKLLLESNEKFNNLIASAKIILRPQQKTHIANLLKYMTSEINNSKQNEKDLPIIVILNEIEKVLTDGKIELYEMPELVNVSYDALKKIKVINITTEDLGILIKILIFILIETKFIKLQNEQYNLIVKVLDASIKLMDKSVSVKIPKTKCFCK